MSVQKAPIINLKVAVVGMIGMFCLSAAHAAEPTAQPVQLAGMSWPEIAAAIERGTTTVIVPTGGIEQNGPHMTLAKHDLIVTAAAAQIAAGLGKTLVAPVVSFVPQGSIAPASGNMLFPGTIGISEPVFEGLLADIATSLKHAGFSDIALVGDHGLSQAAQARVAARLTAEWAWSGVRVHHIGQYYDDRAQIAALQALGETSATIGQHASLIDTAELMSVSPANVDLARVPNSATDLAVSGGSGMPARASISRGAQLLRMRIEAAIKQIKGLRQR